MKSPVLYVFVSPPTYILTVDLYAGLRTRKSKLFEGTMKDKSTPHFWLLSNITVLQLYFNWYHLLNNQSSEKQFSFDVIYIYFFLNFKQFCKYIFI